MAEPLADALVVVDAQAVFADPTSPWGSPMDPRARPRLLERMTAYGDRVVATRYVAPQQPTGAWAPYFAQFPWALVPPDDPLYALLPDVAQVYGDRATVDLTTFGKWGPELEVALAPHGPRSVEVVGYATDCCVVSTVLAMADAGLEVRVRADACGGSSPENHATALALMSLYAPLVRIQ
ncbi:cysteine hydrolase family protein [Lapillicoccus jejuensis]|uniref:Nicotinamidase-related amidase n=1 Tax=Lapillicoccus jejuensis TaxID=402171 RepID=A0A542E3U0_9MICO|nr:cysteine hydrolase [Lapillicoccus jejuensis]TQJ10012.1 nicotinamidase-related amidase [Lapillicoccus jejuensis]